MNKSQEFNEWANLDVEEIDLDTLEQSLQSDVEMNFAELEGLKEDFSKIGNQNTVVDVVKDVVWEQFLNQVAVVAGEDFIKENRGLTLDLRDSAHIQTTENFAQGKIAKHNTYIDYQQRYDDWQDNFERNENGEIKTHKTRSGKIVGNIAKNARKPFDDGRPTGTTDKYTDMDHVIPAAEIIRDPEANAHLTKDEQIDFANSDKNLNEMNASQNRSKGDTPMTEWLDNPNSKGMKPNEIFDIDDDLDKEYRDKDKEAREEYKKRKAEGEKRSIETGKKSQREEFFRSSGKALRSVIMGLLASLLKQILQDLLVWFKSKTKSFKTFIDSIKDSIKNFFIDIKKHLKTAAESFVTTLATMILGPIIGMIKKAWIFLKQGYNSVKQAVKFLKDPANKDKPFSIKLLEVGKIVIAGLTAGGALVLSEVIEKALMTIPGFAFEIPLLGSLANLFGIFFGAVVSGIIGALALKLIDKIISKKLKTDNQLKQIEKGNEILKSQEKLLAVTEVNLVKTKMNVAQDIIIRHDELASSINNITSNIEMNMTEGEKLLKENNEINKNIDDLLSQF